jgi:hypothetical protein
LSLSERHIDTNSVVNEEQKTICRNQKSIEKNLNFLSDTSTSTEPPLGTGPPGSGPSFYNWEEIYPELSIFLEKENFEAIVSEAKSIPLWTPWPESHFSKNGAIDWTVFPFLHTFPALDISKKTFVDSTCNYCPKTIALLKRIPNIRTALFSRLGSGTELNPHTGWEDLANYVLRCHVTLIVPESQLCGLWVDHVEQYHKTGKIIVFDDSKTHYAFNRDASSSETINEKENDLESRPIITSNASDREKTDRIVLIIDILRPSHLPLGNARGGHTPELDNFISQFR